MLDRLDADLRAGDGRETLATVAHLHEAALYDLGVYRNGSLDLVERRLDLHDDYLVQLQQAWVQTMVDAISVLPPLPVDGLTG